MKSHRNITSRRSNAAVIGLALVWLVTPMPAVAQNAYITNQGISPNFSDNVTVIDTTTNKVVTTIEVDLAPSGSRSRRTAARSMLRTGLAAPYRLSRQQLISWSRRSTSV
jgi:YVTN family beta-propeller protein